MVKALFRAVFVFTLALLIVSCSGSVQAGGGGNAPGDTSVPGDTTAPAEISDIIIFLGDSEASIVWTDPTDGDLAHIELTCTGRPVQSVPKGEEYASIKGLTNGVSYDFTLNTVDTAGNKSAGVVRMIQPGSATDPDAPDNPAYLDSAAGDGEATLSWSDPFEWDLAHIEITASGIAAVTVAEGVETATITGLENGKTYTFTLKAVDTDGKKSSGVTIDARPIKSGTLTAATAYYTVGSSPYPLTVQADPPLGAGVTLSWVMTDSSVATVTSGGLVTGYKTGSTAFYVKASDGRESGTKYLHIQAATAPFTVWPESLSLKTGQISLLNPVFGAGSRYLHCESSDSSVVRVNTPVFNTSAFVEAMGTGNATVTITSMDGLLSVTVPVMVGPDSHTASGKWVMTANGPGYAFGIKEDGSLWSWGKNTADANRGTGRNGSWSGVTANSPYPTKIGNDGWKFIGLAAGATGEASSTYPVGIKTDGTLWAWGTDSTFADLGWRNPVTSLSSSRWVPTQIGTSADWVKATGSYRCGFGLKEDGTVWGWGWLLPAHFGVNSTALATYYANPTKLYEGEWKDLRGGTVMYLIKKSDGSLWSVGYSAIADQFYTLRQLGTQTGFKKIVRAGLALKENGELWGWNLNVFDYDSGEWFGNGGAWYGETPTLLNTGTWKDVSVGSGGGWGPMAVMGIKSNGTLWAWYGNCFGEFGNGTTSPLNADLPTATQVGSDTDWAFVSGSTEIVALKTDGSAYTWGSIGDLTGDGSVHLTPYKLP